MGNYLRDLEVTKILIQGSKSIDPKKNNCTSSKFKEELVTYSCNHSYWGD
jgi:hypothetical protein